jgi:hypothetical protein
MASRPQVLVPQPKVAGFQGKGKTGQKVIPAQGL